MNNEIKVRLEVLSQKLKDLQTQITKIKQTIEKVLDKYGFLKEKFCTLFREQGITIISIITALSMTISTVAQIITGVFEGAG